MIELKKNDIIDLLYGCAVLGTGGGGSLAGGFQIMKEDFEQGRVLKIASLDELPDDKYIGTPYGCGAPSAAGADGEAFKDLPKIDDSPAVLAFKGLEEFMGVDFAAVSSTELGGMNTAEALHVACLLDLPLADGDPAGRSVPELIHSTFKLKDIPISPLSVATHFGDVVILKDVVNDERAESLVRAMACVSGDEVNVCDHPVTVKQYREAIIDGAITYAWEVGKVLRKAKEEERDVSLAIAEAMGGMVLFRGEIKDMPWECRDGFDYGNVYLDGIKEYEGEKYQIYFKNENIASYRNGKIDVTVPDLICIIDGNGEPMTTPDYGVGDEMNVIALPAPKMWTTEKGLAIFGPRYFGIDTDYVPFNEKYGLK